MTPDITPADIVKFLGAIAIAVIAWFLRREIDKVGSDLANKADKDHMQRELERLSMELKETRDRRDSDIERMERTSSEKFAEFSASMRDRITSMERAMNDKLDTILEVIRQVRKE